MILDVLAKDQAKWVSMVKAMGCPAHLIGDVIQEMYIKLSTVKDPYKILFNECSANQFYVYLTLRSVYMDELKKEGVYVTAEDVDMEFMSDHSDMDRELGWDRLHHRITEEITALGPYGAKLCNVYFKTDISIRDFAEGSGISPTSIFHSQKQYKKILKENLEEDYQDYLNRDYDKI